MAEGVLFDIVGKVLEGLRPLGLRELSLASNHNSNKQEVTVWLKQLKDAVDDVDDLLDDFSTEVLQQKAMKGNEMSKKVRILLEIKPALISSQDGS
ncbi:Rx [Theobroma cacao]|nr:Rx [Theobroma cacao]